ncbi:hypothetical protein EOD40_04340 [Flavobacterium sufflavum]|uniref:Lipocalin-like domain-containing protein n=1 Tax=Flavobacterium sufflavum TaxID=1921138 RepID=A0A437L0F6_9FLAO|nr:hypothetical protein [Flavobacterium sufflavum]RVT78471.1 hypothetical protein EOD40_04340 [Flavobacterium sufflavum]
MKRFLIIVFLAYSSLIFSQEKDTLIIGKWKVISIETHNYYYNSETDSLSYFKEYKKMLPDLIKSFGYKNLAEFEQGTKKEFANDKFIFKDNNVYLRKKGDKILREGNYTANKSEKTISFKDKDKPEHIMEYFIEKGLLHLTMNFKQKIKTKSSSINLRPTKLILQKITIQ